MSFEDNQRDRTALKSIVGRRCFVTAAVNSLKLHLDENTKGGDYVWIDPPWMLFHGNTLLTASADCPHYTSPSHAVDFPKWAKLTWKLNEKHFLGHEERRDGSITLSFSEKLRIEIPFTPPEEQDELWYDHWYVRIRGAEVSQRTQK